MLLAQGGEFGFVVFQAAAQAARHRRADRRRCWSRAVAMSMLLTPLLLVAADRWWRRVCARGAPRRLDEIDEPQQAPVIIAGFGRYGQIVGRLLFANGIRPTVLDHDAEQVEAMRRFGWPVYYGDATRLDLLRTAGAGQRARAGASRSTTSSRASRWSTWCASTFRSSPSSRARATCSTSTSCASAACS